MHFQVSLLMMSTQCLVWSRDLPHFSPLHTGSFVFRSLQIQGSKFGKTNVHGFLFFYLLNFQQFQATYINESFPWKLQKTLYPVDSLNDCLIVFCFHFVLILPISLSLALWLDNDVRSMSKIYLFSFFFPNPPYMFFKIYFIPAFLNH